MTIRDIFILLGFKTDAVSQKKVEQGIKGIKSFATKALGAIGIGFSLLAIKDIAEEFNGINDQIRDATRGLGDQGEIQQRILQAAQETKLSYADMADSVSKLSQNSDVFDGVEDAANFSELMAKNFASSGKSGAEVSALMKTINMSMARGEVNSRVMMQFFRESPGTLKMMADTLGVTGDKLQDMVAKGQVSAKTLKEVFQKNADGINERFGELDYSISDAMLNIRNQWGVFVDGLNSGLGITQGIAKIMVRGFNQVIATFKKGQAWVERVSKAVGGFKNLLKLVGIVGGSIFLMLKGEKILGFLKSVMKMLGGINLKVLAIIGVIVLIALIVDDFINFMQGNDSLIGDILKNAGIDCDAVRETIINAFEAVKKAFIAVKDFLINAFIAIKKALITTKDFLIKAFNDIKSAIGTAVNFIKGILDALLPVFVGLTTAVVTYKAVMFALAVQTKIQAALTSGLTAKTLIHKAAMLALAVQTKIQAALTSGLTAKTLIHSGVTKAATAVQWLLNAALSANPIGIVVALIAGLVAAIVLLWNKNEGFRNFVIGAWEAIKGVFSTVAEFFSGIVDTIISGFQTAIDWITSLPGKALQWGKDIIQGIIDGILGAVDGVVQAVKGVGEKIKSFLGFSVPDEGPLSDFESWMPDFMGGLAQGIQKNKDMVLGAVKDLTADMAVLVQGSVANPATAGAMASSVSKTMNQSVNISNTFNGDRAGQRKSAVAMEKASGDATGYMARGLAYMR